ncbi:hypothetical protein PCANC_04664 [Puccinia coronata f. sp. avenae]|uniref:Uncharacterized protein n=1 Tax=Puccinia coronata f. sp. avenae TaxID=200324 RepID=A0A2N5W1K7_9BASI|nr:hypothetical protein PCANC_04664 [Puccinia coronata f. sp. avenae]
MFNTNNGRLPVNSVAPYRLQIPQQQTSCVYPSHLPDCFLHSPASHQLSHPLKSQKHVTSSELLLDSRGHKESPRNPARPHWWSGTWPHSNHSAAALAADATPTGQEAFTVNPGPPMLFEASSRQAWLHLLVLPAPYILLGVPRGRLAKPRRVLSVHSLAPNSDTILLTS